MRSFETRVQAIKNQVFREVATLAFEDRLASGILEIPEKIVPGPKATMRCCIYKERAIIGSRIKMAMGGNPSNPNIVEVLDIACDECPVTEYTVSGACRGCLANRCTHTCPRGAISIVNHRAYIDHDLCISCGKCLSACPYSAIIKTQRPCERSCKVGAISMNEDKKAKIDEEKCVGCGSCIYQCPFGAIMDKSYLLDAVKILKEARQKDGGRVCAILAPSIAGQFAEESFGQVVSGLYALGFHSVAEAALGADMSAYQEAEELAEHGLLFNSCCPAFVSYTEKNFPDLKKHISDAPSPMVALASRLKQQDPALKTIFIGPCVAKKTEYRLEKTNGAVDCVLTFEELNALFESRGIELNSLPETPLDQASPYGRNFARSGGVSGAVHQALGEQGITEDDFSFRAVPCSGLDACKVSLLKLSKNMAEGNFIEGMACEGGCVAGPACIVRSPKNKLAVEEHARQARGRGMRDAILSSEQIRQNFSAD